MKLAARLLGAAAILAAGSALAQTAICYNCPPEWADWGGQLKLIKEKTGITVPHDNKNSGQTLAQLVAEKANPVADVAYYGGTFGIKAKEDRRPGALQARALGRDPRRPQGSRRLLVHHPLRHARPLRERRCAQGQAGAEIVEGPPQARSTRAWSAISTRPARSWARSARGGEPGPRRHARATSTRRSSSSRSSRRTTRSCRSRPPTRACSRARSRSCSTTTSTPIAASTRTRRNGRVRDPQGGHRHRALCDGRW